MEYKHTVWDVFAAKLLYNVSLLSCFERDDRNVEAEIGSSLFCGNQFLFGGKTIIGLGGKY